MNREPPSVDCVLLRHGESEDVVAGLVSGQRDSPLTEKGRSQARAAAWKLAPLGVGLLVSSDLSRARETAEIIAGELGLPAPAIDPRLRERHWGEWQGSARTGLAEPPRDMSPPGGESADGLRARVLAALGDVPARALVVCHAGPIREMLGATGRPIRPVAPCEWLDLRAGRGGGFEFQVVAEVLDPGEFQGRVVYVRRAEDLRKLGPDTLAFLCECPKSVAVEAVDLAPASLNLMRSLTAHLTHGRLSARPYAVAMAWPAGLPAEGEFARLAVTSPSAGTAMAYLPDIPIAMAGGAEGLGGKASGLLVLKAAGARVPDFHAVSIDESESWESSGNTGEAARAWCRLKVLPPGSRWAVRSSADSEDSEKDAMSGSFASVLDLSPEDVPAAIQSVLASAKGPEIARRIETGRLSRAPRMAVLVQRMVDRVMMAGAVFIPAPRNPASILLEARWGRTGDGLMDGREHPDIRACYDSEGRRTLMESGRVPEREQPAAGRIADMVARKALALYGMTGRGDMEFAIDGDGADWWLQARPLNEAVEVVDRRGFQPAAIAYYKSLAFRVAEANLIAGGHFRCLDLGEGMFGYSPGIRRRDRLFHETIERNPGHLAEVTRFGWEAERRMAAAIRDAGSRSPESLLEILILHGAVQLPFCIPMRSARMDRYRSRASDGHPSSSLLEDFAGEVSGAMGQVPAAGKIIEMLFQPRETLSVLEGLKGLASIARRGGECRDDELWAAAIPDMRDVPDTGHEGMGKLREELFRRAAEYGGPDEIDRKIQSKSGLFRDSRGARSGFMADAKAKLDPGLFRRLVLWADYLEMKAETNETHCLHRGKAFLHFAKSGFVPS